MYLYETDKLLVRNQLVAKLVLLMPSVVILQDHDNRCISKVLLSAVVHSRGPNISYILGVTWSVVATFANFILMLLVKSNQ